MDELLESFGDFVSGKKIKQLRNNAFGRFSKELTIGYLLTNAFLWPTVFSVLSTVLCCGVYCFGKRLKQVLNQRRPSGSSLKSAGMPSTHALCLTFLGLFHLLYIWNGGMASDEQLPFLFRLFPSRMTLTSLICTFVYRATRHRVTAKLHTWTQVLVGAAIGSTLAFCAWVLLKIEFVVALLGVFIASDEWSVDDHCNLFACHSAWLKHEINRGTGLQLCVLAVALVCVNDALLKKSKKRCNTATTD